MVRNDVFSMVGGLGGDFYKNTYEPKLFGMHSGSVLSGSDAGNANSDMKISILPICRGTCTYTGSTGSFFRCLEALEGTFVRTHMRQSCLGCIVEVFCVVGMQEMRIPTLKCRFNVFVGWGTCTYRS